jgi:hypothetical protein
MSEYFVRVQDIPWIFSLVCAPMQRFFAFAPGCRDDGNRYVYINREELRASLDLAYEWQVIRPELQDPEWPNEYWDKKEEYLAWLCR